MSSITEILEEFKKDPRVFADNYFSSSLPTGEPAEKARETPAAEGATVSSSTPNLVGRQPPPRKQPSREACEQPLVDSLSRIVRQGTHTNSFREKNKVSVSQIVGNRKKSSSNKQIRSSGTEKSKAYFIKSFSVSLQQYEYLMCVTAGWDSATRLLFFHIFASSVIRLQRNKSAWVPVGWELIRENARGANKALLRAVGVEIKPHWHSDVGGESCEYKIPDAILTKFISIDTCISGEEFMARKLVNLMSSKPATRARRNRHQDKSNNTMSEEWCTAVDTIHNNGTVFYMQQVHNHIQELEILKDLAEREYNESLSSSDEELIKKKEEVFSKAKKRWLNDSLCWQAVRNQRPYPFRDGMWIYHAAHKPTGSGRMSHIGGGFQSCSKEMKIAAFSDLPDLRNYDLKDSQLKIAIRLMREAPLTPPLDPVWLVNYLNTLDNKVVYAKCVGMSEGCWKTLLLALIMASGKPKKIPVDYKGKSRVIKEVLKDCGRDVQKANEALVKFREETRELSEVLDRWHNYLLLDKPGGWFYHNKYSVNGNSGVQWCVRNKLGRPFNVTAALKRYPRRTVKSKLTAHLLQGYEQAYIIALINISVKYGFVATANEHDGLICLGEIPEAAKRDAAEQSDLHDAELIEKPFRNPIALHDAVSEAA